MTDPLVLLNPPGLFDGSRFGLSQAVVDPAGGLVFLSGQPSWDESATARGTTYAEQSELALANVRTALEAAGCGPADVLHLRIYARGEVGEHLRDIAPAVTRFLDGHRPGMTALGVTSLASAETLVEFDVVARVHPGRAAPAHPDRA